MASVGSRAKQIISLMAFLLVISLVSASAQHVGKGATKDKDGTEDAITATSAGQTAAVDAKGKLRQPTQEEIDALTAGLKLNDSFEGLTAQLMPSGAMMMDLQGRFEATSIAKINPDGTISQACVTTQQEAKDFLKSTKKPATKQPVWEEK